MFGYLLPLKAELKVREFDTYRAHYCGVCFALRKKCALRTCATLTFDAAFLALLGASCGEGPIPRRSRCPFKPWKRVYVAEGIQADYAAHMNVLLAVGKCKDNWRDEKKLTGALGALALKGPAQRAACLYSASCRGILEGLRDLDGLERENCSDLDEPAAAFGRSMEAVFRNIPGRERCSDALGWLGFNLGRWIYLLDAYDDLEEDEHKGNYNVLIRAMGGVQKAKEQRERVEFNLMHSLEEARAAAQSLPGNSLSPIVDNILWEGAAAATRKVLNETEDPE